MVVVVVVFHSGSGCICCSRGVSPLELDIVYGAGLGSFVVPLLLLIQPCVSLISSILFICIFYHFLLLY